jgi:predicted nuclease with TOPRIM domain
MRNVLEAAFVDLGVTDDGGRFPDELRGVNKTKKLIGLLRKLSSQVTDEMDDLRTRIIEEQSKCGSLRDDNSKLKDRLSRVENELVQFKLRQRLEQLELPEADRVKILECAK